MQDKNIYTIYQKDNDIKAIKNGFSWIGFFLTWIWAFYTRQWVLGILAILFGIFYKLTLKYISIHYLGFDPELSSPRYSYGMLTNDLSNFALMVLVATIFGLKGNKWLSYSLMKKGYEKKINISANNQEQAIRSYKETLK